MTDYRRAREKMVEEQLLARGISDRRVLEAMRRVPRHLFVDEGLRNKAYGDHPLPIGEGQTISQPYIVALMTQALRLIGCEKVLEIGTGSGYQTAVLSEIAAKVYSVERIPVLAQRARKLLDSLGYQTVALRIFDGTYGWPQESPFDAIIVTAGSPGLPEHLRAQLKSGGRLVIPIGDVSSQRLLRYTPEGDGWRREDLGACVFVKLVGRWGWEEPGGPGA